MSQTSPAMQFAVPGGGGSFDNANFSGRTATQTVSPSTTASPRSATMSHPAVLGSGR